MNFLIDANLPRRLVRIFQEPGHTAVHTLELSDVTQVQMPRFWIIQRKTIA